MVRDRSDRTPFETILERDVAAWSMGHDDLESIAGMSVLAYKLNSAGCFLGGVCGGLLSV